MTKKWIDNRRLGAYWHAGLRMFFQQLMYDITLVLLTTVFVVLGLPISLILAFVGLEDLIPLLFILGWFVVCTPILGIFFCDQLFLFWNPADDQKLNDFDHDILEEDHKWGAPNRVQKWFRYWARGTMSFLYMCIPRFLISLPVLILFLVIIISVDRFDSHPMFFLKALAGFMLWGLAAPTLAGALGGWTLRKMFAKWELYSLIHPGFPMRKQPRGSSKKAVRAFQRSRKPTIPVYSGKTKRSAADDKHAG